MTSLSADNVTVNHNTTKPVVINAVITTGVEKAPITSHRFIVRRHLNKLRWIVLTIVFLMLILLPFLHLFQTHLKSNTYELLTASEKVLYSSMSSLTSVVSSPDVIFDNFTGTTWTGTLFGYELSDPLAVTTNAIARISSTAEISWNWAFFATALIPIFLTILLGRFFCGWICPATFIYELNDNLGTWLHKIGVPIGRYKFNTRLKYLILVASIIMTVPLGAALVSSIYPPAVLGREIYFAIAMGGFGFGAMLFITTMAFDLFISRRGICRYVCPGGALYSLLGRFRVLRIKREVSDCNDCGKCNTACQFDLDPMHDDFGQECNNCTACMAICPTDTLIFTSTIRDVQFQGPGHLGTQYIKNTQ